MRASSSRVCFFFFQAEDGIRDGRVTGVQTCALPISRWPGWRRHQASELTMSFRAKRARSAREVEESPSVPQESRLSGGFEIPRLAPLAPNDQEIPRLATLRRSEERRVGKECRPRRAT